jgi:hypothetical protein
LFLWYNTYMELNPILVPKLFNIDLSFIINKPVLGIVFVLYFIFYLLISGVLFYHWHAYGMKSAGIMIARSLFIFVSIFLFVMSGLTIYYF